MSVGPQFTEELERLLLPGHDPGGGITHLDRRRSEYSSSFTIEILEITFQNGNILPVVFKNFSKNSMISESRDIKNQFFYHPEREVAVYRNILSKGDLNTARFYGSVVDKSADRYWLFIEKVPGLEMYQVGEFETWRQVARWLVAFHGVFADQAGELCKRAPLLLYDREYFQLWPQRALVNLNDRSPGIRAMIEKVLSRYDGVIERLLQLPITLLHGDFYASNILAQPIGNGTRICPVDWDMAALGPGLIDLAALISGQWHKPERNALIEAYLGREPTESTRTDIACCQLHLAIQWLGWSPNWRPPEAHRQDWVSQAAELAERLDL